MKKVVIITGASRGFGELIAKKFQKENFHVIATMRNIDSSPSLKELDNIDIKKLDVTVKSDIKNVVDFTIEKYGRIDVLINNAGYGAFGFLEEASDQEIKNQFDVNFFGLIDCIRGVLPQMRKQKDGVIINISSIFGKVSKEKRASYSASKFGLDGITASMSAELSKNNILVNSVGPGFIDTDMTRNILGQSGINKVEQQIPIRRLGNVEEIASFVCWLASDSNTYLTGQNIMVDGGFTRVWRFEN